MNNLVRSMSVDMSKRVLSELREDVFVGRSNDLHQCVAVTATSLSQPSPLLSYRQRWHTHT